MNAFENVSQDLLTFISDGTPNEIVERYSNLAKIAEVADFGEFDSNVVVLDTETTGFSFSNDELTQIAAARIEKGEIVDWFVTFVNPGKPIPEEVAHLTNIHDSDVADAPSPNEALSHLAAFVGDAKVVAHNANFDKTFTTNHPGGYPLTENLWIDSLDLARIALPRMKSHRLLDLVRAFGGPLSTHRADDDVTATCVVYRILLAAVQSMPDPLVEEISTMGTEEEWPTVSVFKFFADRNKESGTENIPFSIRDIRTLRVGESLEKVRPDAEALAQDPEQGLDYPSEDEVCAAFSEDGLVGQLYKNYETRYEQLEMSKEVAKAFGTSTNLMVEAGTGVGKSMAYLVPAMLLAKKNNITIGIATKTNALLDQLVYHELPALNAALEETAGQGLKYSSLKGFSHYPCVRKIGYIANEGPQMKEIQGKPVFQAASLAALLSFIEQTEYDDIDSLKIDYRVLPRPSITTTSHDCLRRKCPYFRRGCFVHGARRYAETADILVTNHSLLFCDIVADGGLLPPVRYWVVDEAHGAESEARRAFAQGLTADGLNRLIQQVGGAETSRNVFVRAERRIAKLDNNAATTLFYGLNAKAKEKGSVFAASAESFVRHIKDLLYFDAVKGNKGYEYIDLWLNDDIRKSSVFSNVASYGFVMIEDAEKLITACQDLVAYLEDIEGAAEAQRDIASVTMELKEIVSSAELIFKIQPEDFVYSARLNRRKDRATDEIEAMLVNVGEKLNENFYEKTHSVVFASATLTVNNAFSSFEAALGLNTSEHSRSNVCRLDSSYNFDEQMTIYVINDMPEPNEPSYLNALQNLLIGAHIAQNGSMLTLFTNRREMESCFDAVNPSMKEHDLRLVCQKWGVSVKGLRDDFLSDEHLSLFALKSFWEGFDAPGSTLKGVVIPKLPFAKPTDPLSCERAVRDEQAWRRYVLPAAVLETKQAAGRLIRKADDTGVLILCDKRLVTKSYGKTFLNSLPSKNIVFCTARELITQLAMHGAEK